MTLIGGAYLSFLFLNALALFDGADQKAQNITTKSSINTINVHLAKQQTVKTTITSALPIALRWWNCAARIFQCLIMTPKNTVQKNIVNESVLVDLDLELFIQLHLVDHIKPDMFLVLVLL